MTEKLLTPPPEPPVEPTAERPGDSKTAGKGKSPKAGTAAISYCGAEESAAVDHQAGGGLPAGLYRRGDTLRIPEDVTPEEAEALCAAGIFRPAKP